MTAIFRPNTAWGPPPSAVKRPLARAVEKRLDALAPVDPKWSRTRDLAIAKEICAGRSIAEVAARQRLSDPTVRARWTALKLAACPEEQPFGIFEQEALLLALTAARSQA